MQQSPVYVFFLFIQILGTLIAAVIAYGKWTAKNREFEFRLTMVEKQFNSSKEESEKRDDRIYTKLESISEEITELKIEVSKKTDRH